MRTTLIAFVALLILFRWLHLILALQIAATGRQLQIQQEELGRIERYNAMLRLAIAKATLPSRLATEAEQYGYGPRDPLYLLIAVPDPSSGEGERPSPAGEEGSGGGDEELTGGPGSTAAAGERLPGVRAEP